MISKYHNDIIIPWGIVGLFSNLRKDIWEVKRNVSFEAELIHHHCSDLRGRGKSL